MKKEWRIGFIVNPYAGIGGEAALKGSDGELIRQQALAYSQDKLRSPTRAKRFIDHFNQFHPIDSSAITITWFTGPNGLGETAFAQQENINVQAININHSAEDTKAVAAKCLDENLDLLLFVGGDGTARDVLDTLKQAKPSTVNLDQLCLGIPAGVKMQSGVFAVSPEAAAEMLAQLLQGELNSVALQDVRDIDEFALRENRLRSKFYGEMNTLSSPYFLQHLKQGGIESDELVLDEIADHLQDVMDEGYTLLLGPGSTTAYFMQRLGLKNTLVGFDAVANGELLQQDLNAKDCLALQKSEPQLKVVISPTAQQGFFLGRGNQQLSAEFITKLDKNKWLIVSTKEKLLGLKKQPLLLDTNDPQLDKALSGLYPIITAYKETVLYPVSTNYSSPL